MKKTSKVVRVHVLTLDMCGRVLAMQQAACQRAGLPPMTIGESDADRLLAVVSLAEHWAELNLKDRHRSSGSK